MCRRSSPTILKRGKACIHCRRRKMRCDGQRPVCGQCLRGNRTSDCEYTDGQGRTRTQMLEENISRLEARLQELEHPDLDFSVKLHDPYSQSQQPLQGTSRSVLHQEPVSYLPTPSASTSGHPSPSSVQRHSFDAWDDTMNYSGDEMASVQDYDTSGNEMEPCLPDSSTLIDSLLTRGSQLGFFLNRDSKRGGERFTTPLLCSVHLLGAHITEKKPFTTHEPALLSQALQETSIALSSSHPRRILHTIQANVLLANYLFRNNRFLEGRFQYHAAVLLAIDNGLHKMRSCAASAATLPLIDAGPILPPAQDSVEEGERINAFWTVFIMDKAWSAIFDSPSLIPDCDTNGEHNGLPNATKYETGQPLLDVHGFRTLQKFLIDIPDEAAGGVSSLALLAKASYLFDRGSFLARQWRADMQQHESKPFCTAFVSLLQRIGSFLQSLPSPNQLETASAKADIVLAHSLAFVAMIKMHGVFASKNNASKEASIKAAKALLDMVKDAEAVCLNPLMPVLWTAACRVLLEAIEAQAAWTIDGDRDLFTILLEAMAAFGAGASYPLMKSQLVKVQEGYSPHVV